MGRCAQKRPVKSKSVRENKSWSKGSKRAGSGTQTNRILGFVQKMSKWCVRIFRVCNNAERVFWARQTENVNGERLKTFNDESANLNSSSICLSPSALQDIGVYKKARIKHSCLSRSKTFVYFYVIWNELWARSISPTVRIWAFQARDPGSTPGWCTELNFIFLQFLGYIFWWSRFVVSLTLISFYSAHI